MSIQRDGRSLDTPLDRRTFLRLTTSAAGVAAGTALLAACGGSSSTPTTAPAGTQSTTSTQATTSTQSAPTTSSTPSTGGTGASAASTPAASSGPAPKRGGTFKIPVNANITPWPPIGAIQNLMVNKSLFNGLVRYSPTDWTPQPDLAESWDTSSDGLTWTFHLRKGVTWHDGKLFTADDVKYTLGVYKDPNVNSILLGNLEPVSSIDVVDANTVKVTTKTPYSSFVELLCYLCFMLPQHLLQGQKFDRTTFPQDFIQHPVGTGPFKFGEHVPGDHFTVVANENYYEGRPYLDSVIYKIVRDQNSTIAQVKTGELDIAFPSFAQLSTLQGTSNLQIIERGLMDYRFFAGYYKNPQFGPWFSQKAVRQALAYAIDVQGIIKQVTQGKADRSNGPLPPALKAWYIPDLPVFDYDPNKAGQMLSDAGFKKGSDGILAKDGQKYQFTFYTDQGQPEREQTALILQQNFKDIGIDAKLQTLEFNDLQNRYRVTHDFTAMAYYYVTPATPDQHSYWQTNGSTNEWAYSNPDVDKLFDQAMSTFDVDKRKATFKQLYTILADDQAVNFIYHPHELQAINKRVQGWAETDYRDALLYLSKVWMSS